MPKLDKNTQILLAVGGIVVAAYLVNKAGQGLEQGVSNGTQDVFDLAAVGAAAGLLILLL